MSQTAESSGTRSERARERTEATIRRKLDSGLSLADVAPLLASQWHPIRNGGVTPRDRTFGSSERAWWLCPVCGNEWETAISNRYHGSGCGRCGDPSVRFWR